MTQAFLLEGARILAIDTCGPAGSVALGRLQNGSMQWLGLTELEGRTYSATLIAAIRDLLAAHGAELRSLAALAIVHGPGSFTGIRVGLSAAKGLAEAACLPMVALSRLEVLAAKAVADSAALDAHRREIFLRIAPANTEARELLAGIEELAALPPPAVIAVCEEAAASLLSAAWPGIALTRVSAPTAADALPLALDRIRSGRWADVALSDGHYLRRSDAEIFGEKAASA